jgi:cytidyltransferase-like protein
MNKIILNSKTCVVTGCFQILHRGHINLLEKASEYGDVTVLLNSDKGVLALKGYLAESFSRRKKNLLNTGLVSRVIEFYTDPTEFMSQLKPDILLAGSDHTKEEIISKGGKYAKQIVILPYTKGICSTDLYKETLK